MIELRDRMLTLVLVTSLARNVSTIPENVVAMDPVIWPSEHFPGFLGYTSPSLVACIPK
jgi:hypothetical protein